MTKAPTKMPWRSVTLTWLMYCRMARSLIREYIRHVWGRIHQFPNARNGSIFIIKALEEDPHIALCEFRIFVNFTHVLCAKYELRSGSDVDIYEQVGMFLFILAHGKG
ncbi:Uncharacterized protein Adt_33699 [Abeliophyllum distichum]|uniref:Uncharacterized protein n=1 Tax=Abeliophyllum distichum TaxID=126358 RepID=A0ABD1QX51_9LAMI